MCVRSYVPRYTYTDYFHSNTGCNVELVLIKLILRNFCLLLAIVAAMALRFVKCRGDCYLEGRAAASACVASKEKALT